MATKVRWRSCYGQETSVDPHLHHYHQVYSVFVPIHGPLYRLEDQMY